MPKTKARMNLLYGGKVKSYRLGGVLWTPARSQSNLPDMDAVVFEEDTHLVLTVNKRCTLHEKHPLRMMTDLYTAKRHRPGSLVINGNSWYGVTIDLDCDPVCRSEWIEQVYTNIAKQVKKSKISKLGVHLLGNVHAGLDVSVCVDLLLSGLGALKGDDLDELLIIVPDQFVKTVRCRLRNVVAAKKIRL